MAHSDPLSSEYVQAVSKQVGQLIFEGVHDEPACKRKEPGYMPTTQDSCKLGDSLEVWTLDKKGVEGFNIEGRDLDKVAQRTGQWQHLLKVNGQSKTLVRSIVTKDQREPSVSQVQTSPLAGRIADAISLVEKETTANSGFRKKVGDDPLVRWLSVPFYRVYALWLINESRGENYVIVVDSTQSIKLKTRELLSSREFVEALPREQKTFSIS